jgi:hypothetical protein
MAVQDHANQLHGRKQFQIDTRVLHLWPLHEGPEARRHAVADGRCQDAAVPEASVPGGAEEGAVGREEGLQKEDEGAPPQVDEDVAARAHASIYCDCARRVISWQSEMLLHNPFDVRQRVQHCVDLHTAPRVKV